MKIEKLKLASAIPILLITLFLFSSISPLGRFQTATQGTVIPASGSTSDPMEFNATLTGRGATFPAPLILNWTSEYHSLYPNVTISYTLTGSGTGQNFFFNKTDDFDASDAPLQPIQRPLAQDVLHIPETIGSVTLSYNLPGITKSLNITGPIIADIYMGTILNWNDPAIQSINPGVILPNHQIITVHRSDGSGTTFIFTSFLSADSSAWASSVGFGTSVTWPGSPTGSPPPIALTGNGNPGVASVISGTPYAFGYVELNYAIANHFTYCTVLNPAGNYILPTLQTTNYAVENSTGTLPAGGGDWSTVNMINKPGTQTYPMASFTYILVHQNLNGLPSMDNNETFQANALINFLYWIVNAGQKFSAGNFYVPLPTFVRQIDNASIASITFHTPPKNTRTIHLTESSTNGWNGTNPGPTITIYSGDTLNLALTSGDLAPHNFYIDYNDNRQLDPNEAATSSGAFSSSSPTSSTIHPAIGVNAPASGTYTYRDANDESNTGTIQIIQQQVAVPMPVPTKLSSSPNHVDSSKVTTVGSLVVNMRTLTFSGNLSEIAVDSTSGSITFSKNYTLTNLVLHTVPSQAGVQDRIALNAAVLPYALSTVITLQLTGTAPTLQNFVTRELDMAGNGFVSIVDASIVFADYGFSSGQSQYNPQADLTAAGTVNITDASIEGASYGDLVFR